MALSTCSGLRVVELNNNLLGNASEGQMAPISKIEDVLTLSKSIEIIDISNNFIEQKSTFCIA